MAETVYDIVGKGFKYEERVEVETLYDRIETSIAGSVGAANWGPAGTATKVLKNFKNYFGTEVNRDITSKDYAGIAMAKFLQYSGTCIFTRITDGTDTKSSKVLMKLATAATLVGREVVTGRSLKVNASCDKYITSLNGAPDTTVTLSHTTGAAEIESSSLPLLITDPLAINFSVGDYFEFYVDGQIYQHIISSATSILCRLTTGDDSLFGGQAGQNVINYVDRLVYAIKSVVVGSGDSLRVIRKSGTDKIMIASHDAGTDSNIRINSFPIVFPTATSSSPLQSVAINTSVDDIITQINTIISATGSAFIDSNSKYETQTNLTGASTSLKVKQVPAIDLNADFTDILIAGAGAFLVDPSASWTQVTDGFKSSFDFFVGEVSGFNTGAGVNATAGRQDWGFTVAKVVGDTSGLDNSTAFSHTGTIDLTAGYDFSILTEAFSINYNGGGVTPITLNANCVNAAAVALHVKARIDVAIPVNTITVTAVGGFIVISSSVTGTAENIVLAAGVPDALAVLGWTAATYAGLDGSTYTASIAVNGTPYAISVLGVDLTTFTDVINELNSILGVNATASWATVGNGFIRVTSALTGATSSVLITDTNLFSLMTNVNAAAETAVAGADATHGWSEFTLPTIVLSANDPSLIPAGTYKISRNLNGGGAADVSFTLLGNETWKQAGTAMALAVNAASTADVVGGRLRIYSNTTGVASTLVLAEAAAAATGISLVYNAGPQTITLSSTGANKTAQRLAQRFTVSGANSYGYQEVYFVPSGGGYTTGVIRFSIYKGRELIAFRNITSTDISNGVYRTSVYFNGAGTYEVVFEVAIENTATSLTFGKLYVGPYRLARTAALLTMLGVYKVGSYDLTYDAILRPENNFVGADADLNIGTLEAYYTGSDGNLLTMVKSTDNNGIESMVFSFGSTVVGQFANFSYTVADPLFFGSLINNDTAINKWIKYILPLPTPVTVSQIDDGVYTLSGGTSGIAGLTDVQYTVALDALKNMDIFDVDVIAVPGNSTEIIYDKIKEICEYRRDCFGIFDPPEVVAGKPGGVATGGSTQMIYWHNGQLPALLTKKLDTKYVTTYFPWLLLSTQSSVNTQQWHAPSVIVMPTLARLDLTYTAYIAPAGIKAYNNDILDIAYYLTEEQKGSMYDDTIGNNINPIVYTSRNGFFIDGQKTTQREKNAYNRINVMRVSLFIKRRLMNIVPQFFFQPLTKDTYSRLAASIDQNIMTVLKTQNAIKDTYTIDVGSGINTDIVAAQGGMIAVITWSPRKVAEKIKIISIMRDQQVTVQL